MSVDMETETVVCGCSHLTNFGLLVVSLVTPTHTDLTPITQRYIGSTVVFAAHACQELVS